MSEFINPDDVETSSDPLDQASVLEMRFTQMSLDAQLAQGKPEREYEEGEEYSCEECGCDLPIERARRGYALCIDCKQWEDRSNKIKKIRGEM